MQLNADSIINAAVEILDSYGLADMSMRRVASHLNVAPGALYWHIANKQELIGAIAEQVLAPVLAGPGPDARTTADALRSALLGRRDGAELVGAALSVPASTLADRLTDVFAQSLATMNLPAEERRAGARALFHQVLGATGLEQSQLQFAEVTDVPYPGAMDPGYGVDLLLEGLAGRAT